MNNDLITLEERDLSEVRGGWGPGGGYGEHGGFGFHRGWREHGGFGFHRFGFHRFGFGFGGEEEEIVPVEVGVPVAVGGCGCL